MKSVSVTEFKSRCLDLLDEVQRSRRAIVITRYGKALAKIVPPTSARHVSNPLKGSVLFQGDLISPISLAWHSDS